MLTSCLCTEKSLLSKPMLEWAERLKEAPGHLHRKVWEWCFISQALAERGMLSSGKRGLGFAVGQEPLTAAFANLGARITATDLFAEDAAASGWIKSSQHASGFSAINSRRLCAPEKLESLVRFEFLDMNKLGNKFDDQYDFVWSSCALEHLGNLEKGLQFIANAMHCLKPGGYAVHTTEFNVSSDSTTVETGETVLYRRQDIERLVGQLHALGHTVDIDWTPGDGRGDNIIDVPPYKHDVHLKLAIGSHTVTSLGLIIQKARR